MERAMIFLLLGVGGALVLGSVLLRVLSGGRYEVKTTDLVFLVIPLIVAAIATGKVKGLDLFGVRADLSALWAEAARTGIEKQVAPSQPATVQDAVRVVEMASKGGVEELRRMIQRKVEALEFRLGHGGYYAPAIRTYFEALSGSSYLRAVVIDHADGRLFGIFTAPDLIGFLRVAGDPGYQQLQQMLNSGSAGAQAELAKLPGFVAAEHAVTGKTSKREALERMEKIKAESLPVVDDRQRFVGTVERGQLTASLILAVSAKLEAP
jgi:CBS domain-containing protein